MAHSQGSSSSEIGSAISSQSTATSSAELLNKLRKPAIDFLHNKFAAGTPEIENVHHNCIAGTLFCSAVGMRKPELDLFNGKFVGESRTAQQQQQQQQHQQPEKPDGKAHHYLAGILFSSTRKPLFDFVNGEFVVTRESRTTPEFENAHYKNGSATLFSLPTIRFVVGEPRTAYEDADDDVACSSLENGSGTLFSSATIGKPRTAHEEGRFENVDDDDACSSLKKPAYQPPLILSHPHPSSTPQEYWAKPRVPSAYHQQKQEFFCDCCLISPSESDYENEGVWLNLNLCLQCLKLLTSMNRLVGHKLRLTNSFDRKRLWMLFKYRYNSLENPMKMMELADLYKYLDPITTVFFESGFDKISHMIENWWSNIQKFNFTFVYVPCLLFEESVASCCTLRTCGHKIALISYVATLEKFRGRGFCKALIAKVEELLRKLGIKLILVLLPALTITETFWKKIGYRSVTLTEEILATTTVYDLDVSGTTLLKKEL